VKLNLGLIHVLFLYFSEENGDGLFKHFKTCGILGQCGKHDAINLRGTDFNLDCPPIAAKHWQDSEFGGVQFSHLALVNSYSNMECRSFASFLGHRFNFYIPCSNE